ncbi:MAG: MerR family transcriptional regulator [Bacteroidales bacterium]|nr:MerR family transcriptional regulator [Bacteroidales bacterium]
MPEGNPSKIYYSIGEVAKMFDVNTSLIRFWEKEFSIIKPRKNKKGNRLFTKNDIKNLRLIHHLVKERGYTLKGAKETLKKNPETIDKDAEVIDSLMKIKKFLTEMKEGLEE